MSDAPDGVCVRGRRVHQTAVSRGQPESTPDFSACIVEVACQQRKKRRKNRRCILFCALVALPTAAAVGRNTFICTMAVRVAKKKDTNSSLVSS